MDPRRQRGLSLIELMISLLLGALVLSGLVAIFQQSKSSSVQDEEIARMQENGRFALRHISRELGMLGFFGGMLRVESDPVFLKTSGANIGVECDAGWMLDLDVSVEFTNEAADVAATGYGPGTGNDNCIASNGELKAKTDVLAIRRLADRPVRWFDETGAADPESEALVDGQLYFKTNRVMGEMFSGKTSEPNGPTFVGNELAAIYAYAPAVFYIRPYAVTAGDGIPTLVRETLVANNMVAQPLVEGVEDMQIEFGVDGTDADLAPDYYITDPDADELASSVTARIYLLVRSINPVAGYTNDKVYTLGSTTIDPNPDDAYYRRVYSTTVQLRNGEKFKMQALN